MGKRERTGAGPLVTKATFFWGLSWGVEGTMAEIGLFVSESSLEGGSGGVGKAGVGGGRGGRMGSALGWAGIGRGGLKGALIEEGETETGLEGGRRSREEERATGGARLGEGILSAVRGELGVTAESRF